MRYAVTGLLFNGTIKTDVKTSVTVKNVYMAYELVCGVDYETTVADSKLAFIHTCYNYYRALPYYATEEFMKLLNEVNEFDAVVRRYKKYLSSTGLMLDSIIDALNVGVLDEEGDNKKDALEAVRQFMLLSLRYVTLKKIPEVSFGYDDVKAVLLECKNHGIVLPTEMERDICMLDEVGDNMDSSVWTAKYYMLTKKWNKYLSDLG